MISYSRLLLVVSEVLRAHGVCNTPSTDLFEQCPQVLQVGESCPPSCPAGLYAKAYISCQDDLLLVPNCLDINTSTTSSTTTSGTTTSTATTSSTASTRTTTSTASTLTETSSTSSTATATTTGSSTTSSSASSTSERSSTTSRSTTEANARGSSTTTVSANSTEDENRTDNATDGSTLTSATQFTSTTTQFTFTQPGIMRVKGDGCVVASLSWTSCRRYMLHLERCSAVCQAPSASVGHFACLTGRFFGSSGCLDPMEASNIKWRGSLLAAALRVGFRSLQLFSEDELAENLRRLLAVCVGVASDSIVRLRVVDLTQGDSGQAQVISSELELEFEVSLGNEQLNESEVSASIVDLGDGSSPVSLLFGNMLKGYFDIQVAWVEVEMPPVAYSGSLINFTNFTYPSTTIVTAPTEDPGTTTTVVSGLVLSMAVIPVVAAWVRLILAERNGYPGGSQEELQKGRPIRKKLKSRPSQGPAAVDAG